MPELSIQEHVKTIIQTQVIQALNSAPEAINKLVQAALSAPVGPNGVVVSYGGTPYLDWLVGEEIRQAARTAVSTVLKEHMPTIEEHVRQGLQAESVVQAVAKAITGAADQDWRIDVKFAKENR